MTYLSWNCQGLGRPLTIQKLRELIRSHAPSVVFLMETKQGSYRVNGLRRRFGYSKGLVVDPCGLSGGLALWWRLDVDVNVLSSSKNVIDTVLLLKDRNTSVRVTWVYGPPHWEDKQPFWPGMNGWGQGQSLPWVVIGDLNEVLGNDEKEGGNLISWSRTRFLREFMDSNSLFDLGFRGCKFTWQNQHVDGTLIKSRLDRGLGNEAWLRQWPNSSVIHCPRMGSDYALIILSLTPTPPRHKKRFKFEARWSEDPKCASVIENAWLQNMQGNACSNLARCLSICRRELSVWSRLRSPNCKVKIDQLLSELGSLQQLGPSNPHNE